MSASFKKHFLIGQFIGSEFSINEEDYSTRFGVPNIFNLEACPCLTLSEFEQLAEVFSISAKRAIEREVNFIFNNN